MSDSTSRVVLDLLVPLAVIHFTRPAERNKLTTATLEELDVILNLCENRIDVRAIIFTGAESSFASGADINELRALTTISAREFSEHGQNIFRRIANAPQLTIAAVNGFCIGGGLDLALSCDLRFASHKAIFAHPGATLGIITGWSGTQRLPALIGTTRAIELFLTARRLTSAEAFAWGLVNCVSDDPLDAARAEVAHRFGSA